MTNLSLTRCCQMLALDPKTLRRWLSLAQMSVLADPLDARVKCLTLEQLHQLALAHRRMLPLEEPDRSVEPCPSALPRHRLMMSITSQTQELATSCLPTSDLNKPLADLQTQIVGLQQPLALLTEQLQKERELRETQAAVSEDVPPPKPLEPSVLTPTVSTASPDLPTPEADSAKLAPRRDRRRRAAHILPVVEYAAQGAYVVICPQQGKLSLQPDSPEWFAWLDTLPSFRFLGQFGRFTAHRGYDCPPSTPWRAHRQIRNHSYNSRLGKTEYLTIEALEQAAASLQSHM